MKNCGNFKPVYIIPMIIGGLLLGALFAFLFGFLVMWLWNWLMPEIFGLPVITYWQAWGLVILAHILFKLGGFPHPHHHRDKDKNHEYYKSKFKDRFCRDKQRETIDVEVKQEDKQDPKTE